MSWQPICKLSELQPARGKYVEVRRACLAIFLHEDRVFAMDNACPHAGANLAGGFIEEGCVVCPKHNWSFRLEDGQLRDSPGVNVQTYPVRVVDNPAGEKIVEVLVPEET